MRIMRDNATAEITLKTFIGRGEYGEDLYQETTVTVRGILQARQEQTELGNLESRMATYDSTLMLMGENAEAIKDIETGAKIKVNETDDIFTVKEVSKAERIVSLRNSRISKNVTLFMERAK